MALAGRRPRVSAQSDLGPLRLVAAALLRGVPGRVRAGGAARKDVQERAVRGGGGGCTGPRAPFMAGVWCEVLCGHSDVCILSRACAKQSKWGGGWSEMKEKGQNGNWSFR